MTQLEQAFDTFQDERINEIQEVINEFVNSERFANMFCNIADDNTMPLEQRFAAMAAAMFKFGQVYAGASQASRPPEALRATTLLDALKLIGNEGLKSPANVASINEVQTLHNLDLVVLMLQKGPARLTVNFMASMLRAGKILGRDEAMREMLEGKESQE